MFCRLPFRLSPSLSPLSYSRQLFSAFDSVSAFGFCRSSISAFTISVSVFLVSSLSLSPLFHNVLVLRFRFQYPVASVPPLYTTSLSPLVSVSRHPYNMSPIATFLVSGLLPFVLASLRRLFILGFLAMSPVPFMASCFSLGVQVGCCLPSGFEDPCKTSLSSPPPFRLGQSLCISPPIVRRPFEFPLSAVVSLR